MAQNPCSPGFLKAPAPTSGSPGSVGDSGPVLGVRLFPPSRKMLGSQRPFLASSKLGGSDSGEQRAFKNVPTGSLSFCSLFLLVLSK